MTLVRALVTVLILATALPLAADDWIVDNRIGSDSTRGADGKPLRTIQRAIELAAPGDRIILIKNDEPYREALSLTARKGSGLMGKPLTIVGNGAALEGSEPINPSRWEQVSGDVFRHRPDGISYQMLYLRGKPAARRTVSRDQEVATALQPLEWTQRDGWIYFRTEPTKAPFQYDLACCQRTVGITLYQVRHVLITDLVIQGFQYDGINAPDLVTGAEIAGCTIRGNGRSGVAVGGAAELQLTACLVGDNGVSQVRSEGVARLTIQGCDIIEQEGILPIDRQGGRITVDGRSIRP